MLSTKLSTLGTISSYPIAISNRLILFLALTVTIGGLILLIGLTAGFFFPLLAVVTGGFLAFQLIRKLPSTKSSIPLWLFVVFVAGTFSRLPPSNYIVGGQDQGLYSALSSVIEAEHSFYFTDSLRQNLPLPLQEIYDRYHLSSSKHLPGDTSRIEIQFYPFLPVLMAFARHFGGPDTQGIPLVLVSLLSIFGFFLLANEIADDVSVGIWAFFLLAINPFHIFFSKFSVSDNLALFLNCFGIYLFLLHYRCDHNSQKSVSLFASLLFFFASFLTRMSFFSFLPTLAAISGFAVFRQRRALGHHRTVLVYGALWCIGATLSLCFYSIYFPTLFFEMGIYEIFPILRRLLSILFWVVPVMMLTGFLIFKIDLTKLKRYSRASIGYIENWWPLAFPFLSIYSLYQLFKDGEMPPYDSFNFGHGNWENLRTHVFVRLLVLFFPFWLFALLVRPNDLRIKRNFLRTLIFFSISVWTLILVRAPTMPYLFYYGRYFLSELYLGIMILLAGSMAAALKRETSVIGQIAPYVLLTSGLVYSAFYLWAFVGKSEQQEPPLFRNIATEVKPQDLLIAEAGKLNRMIFEPLRYQLRKNIFVLASDLTEKEKTDVINFARQQIATGRLSRLLFIGTEALGPQGISCTRPLLEQDFAITIFSNGDHALDGGLKDGRAIEQWLMPYRTIRRVVTPVALYDSRNCGDLPGGS